MCETNKLSPTPPFFYWARLLHETLLSLEYALSFFLNLITGILFVTDYYIVKGKSL